MAKAASSATTDRVSWLGIREGIFDLGFTRKPGGRGMGLYISRQTLAKAGCGLTLENHLEFPVCFRISEKREVDED